METQVEVEHAKAFGINHGSRFMETSNAENYRSDSSKTVNAEQTRQNNTSFYFTLDEGETLELDNAAKGEFLIFFRGELLMFCKINEN